MTYIFTNRLSHKANWLTKLFNKCSLVVVLFLTSISFSQTATAPSLGDGSSGNPYQIATLENLYWLSQQQDNSDGTDFYWSRNYIQTADIDASESSGWDGGNGWTPIGNITRNFTGIYNGNGYLIDGLFISRGSTECIGLFGFINGASAEIKNLGVININMTGYNYTGGIVGHPRNSSKISDCYSTGIVSSTNRYAGGIIGWCYNSVTISNCYSTASVTGKGRIGGLVGYNWSGTISNCFATGSVSGTIIDSDMIGGLVGENYDGAINRSFSIGSVDGIGSSSIQIGGLVGFNSGSGSINNCYSTGSVDGYRYVGGLVGQMNSGSITNTFATGPVSGESNYSGGLIAYKLLGTTSNNYWDQETTGQNGGYGGWPMTTAEMKTQSTFTNAGWDFVGEATNGTNDYWEMNSGFNNGYPILSWQSVEVTGITTTPEIISTSNIGFTAQSGSISLNFVEMNSTPSNLPGEAVTISKYWEISDITGGNVKLRLYYLTSLASSFSGNPTIIHYNGSNWEILPTEAPVTVGLLTYVETTNYYSSFSPVSVGDDASPLPVELVSFTGELVDNAVELNWETATETNNYGFEIQKSEDRSQNSEWETIGFVQGNGTTNSPKYYEFTDSELPNAEEVSYRLKQIDNDGTFAYSKIVTLDLTTITDVDDEIKHTFSLEQNYPNPFNPNTTINFTIPSNVKSETSNTMLIVYDILGREVATLVNQQMQPGNHEVSFNADNFSSGMYFYKLTTGNFVQTKKMLLIK